MATPPFELEQQLKSVLYPHSADQIAVFSLAQCTSCNKYMQNLFAFSHLNISLLFCLFPMPRTLSEPICNFISLANVSVKLSETRNLTKTQRDISKKQLTKEDIKHSKNNFRMVVALGGTFKVLAVAFFSANGVFPDPH